MNLLLILFASSLPTIVFWFWSCWVDFVLFLFLFFSCVIPASLLVKYFVDYHYVIVLSFFSAGGLTKMLSAPLSHPKPTSLEDLPQRHEHFIPFQNKNQAVCVFCPEKTTVLFFHLILSKKSGGCHSTLRLRLY